MRGLEAPPPAGAVQSDALSTEYSTEVFKGIDAGFESKSTTASDAVSGASTSSISPHYDSSADIVTRQEWITSRAMKNLIVMIEASTAMTIVLLALVTAFKLKNDASYVFTTRTVQLMGVILGSLCGAALTAASAGYLWRVYRSAKSGKRWSARRWNGVLTTMIQLALQWANVVAFTVGNGRAAARPDCVVMDIWLVAGTGVQWTCWNSLLLLTWIQAQSVLPVRGQKWLAAARRSDASGVDVPLHMQWPKLGVWLAFEAVVVAWSVKGTDVVNSMAESPASAACRVVSAACAENQSMLVLSVLATVAMLLYIVLYLVSVFRSFAFLRRLPYAQFRMANTIVRIQVRLKVLAWCAFFLCLVLYTLVDVWACASMYLSALGYLPMQVLMTVITIAQAFLTTPKRPADDAILRVWLAEFAWAEADQRRKLAERASTLAPHSEAGAKLAREPMWCFETALKLMYWSFLCYDHDEGSDSAYDADTALQLYDLHSFEMVWERSLDSKAVIGWSDDTVVIAFRGTASLANVLADLQIWRTRFPPRKEGEPFCFRPPMVHSGFQKSYTANGFNKRVFSRIFDLVRALGAQQGPGQDEPAEEERERSGAPPEEGPTYYVETREHVRTSSESEGGKTPVGGAEGERVADSDGMADSNDVIPDTSPPTRFPVSALENPNPPVTAEEDSFAGTPGAATPPLHRSASDPRTFAYYPEGEPGRRRPVRVYITGHSLGGALATLAAFDLLNACAKARQACEVTVYTFGAPRTGNAAFARAYEELVPDTWHVINSDDTVTSSGKFWGLYKRPGHRAIITARGDLIVRPAYVEQFALRAPGAGSVRDHYLTSYQRSMLAVVAAQFSRKAYVGGREGARALADGAGTKGVLAQAGLTLESMDEWERAAAQAPPPPGIGLGDLGLTLDFYLGWIGDGCRALVGEARARWEAAHGNASGLPREMVGRERSAPAPGEEEAPQLRCERRLHCRSCRKGRQGAGATPGRPLRKRSERRRMPALREVEEAEEQVEEARERERGGGRGEASADEAPSDDAAVENERATPGSALLVTSQLRRTSQASLPHALASAMPSQTARRAQSFSGPATRDPESWQSSFETVVRASSRSMAPLSPEQLRTLRSACPWAQRSLDEAAARRTHEAEAAKREAAAGEERFPPV